MGIAASRLNTIPVGASLLAMVCQSTSMQLIDHREQARSHNVRGCTQVSSPTQINCGSELARDSVRSIDIDVG
ncbi:hypothetical protein C1X63_29280 [Pseudomonas sp. FW305-131]|nr:hypothetical protein C1X63_29280 [Pseudomonas sp. FW305-131]